MNMNMNLVMLRNRLYCINENNILQRCQYSDKNIKFMISRGDFIFITDYDNVLSIYARWGKNMNVYNITTQIQNMSATRNFLYMISDDSELLYIDYWSYTKEIFNIETKNPVISVACGFDHVIIIDDHRQVWSQGYNVYYQLALHDTVSRGKFTLTEFDDVMSVSCGYNNTLILCSSGQVFFCGHVCRFRNLAVDIKEIYVPDIIKIYISEKLIFLINCYGDIFFCFYGEQNFQDSDTFDFKKIPNLTEIEDVVFSRLKHVVIRNSHDKFFMSSIDDINFIELPSAQYASIKSRFKPCDL